MNQTQPNIYQLVTDRIIAALEKGCIPWKQPFSPEFGPRNYVTGRPYRGINIFVLRSLPYSSPDFLSFKQVAELGGSIIKGEKSCPVVFWKQMEKEDKETGEKKKVWLLRYYNVFNVEQCTNIPIKSISTEPIDMEPIPACKRIVAFMPNPPYMKTIREQEAYYIPSQDMVCMPAMSKFRSKEAYYVTLFHELIHSTGNEKRLHRPGVTEAIKYGSPTYSMEELIAEMGACFLASQANIPGEYFDNSASYIGGWLQVFKNDRTFLMKASGQAQKAADYILLTQTLPDEVPEREDAVTA